MKAYGSKKFGMFYGPATNITGSRKRRNCPCCQVNFNVPSKKTDRRAAKDDIKKVIAAAAFGCE